MLVNSLEELEGKWINDFCKLLTVPKLENGRITALAIVEESLCIVELKHNNDSWKDEFSL